jgi:hypothetical protein
VDYEARARGDLKENGSRQRINRPAGRLENDLNFFLDHV